MLFVVSQSQIWTKVFRWFGWFLVSHPCHHDFLHPNSKDIFFNVDDGGWNVSERKFLSREKRCGAYILSSAFKSMPSVSSIFTFLAPSDRTVGLPDMVVLSSHLISRKTKHSTVLLLLQEFSLISLVIKGTLKMFETSLGHFQNIFLDQGSENYSLCQIILLPIH